MKLVYGVLLFLLMSYSSAWSAVEPFRARERVVFLGDSITHYGRWWPYLWCGYAAQFPTEMPVFINAGFSGDTAGGALMRLERDVFFQAPDTVCVMFGMNDINRRSYTEANTPEDQEAQKRSLRVYEQSMNALLTEISKRDIRCIVVTPSPYDQTLVHPEADQVLPGCNDGLSQAAAIARKLAHEHDCEIVDLHGPMTLLNAERQAAEPSASIIGMDRIHPGTEGAKIMAKLFLESQGLETRGVDDGERFHTLWEYVHLERHLRNIVWLEDRVLKPEGVDTADIEASKVYIRDHYDQTPGGNRIRAKSFFDWRGKESELHDQLTFLRTRITEL